MSSFLQTMKGATAQKYKNKPIQNTQTNTNSIDQDIIAWQKTPTPEATAKIIDYLKPTINSALKTYAPGAEDSLKIKATSYALNSLKNYDPKQKVAPKTYVFTNLQRLSRIKRQRQNIMHIPQSQIYAKMQLDKAIAKFNDQYNRDPSDQELADKLHISVKKIQKLMNQSAGTTINDSSAINMITGQSMYGNKDVTDQDYYDYVYRSVNPTDQLIMQYNKKNMSNNDIAKKLKLSPGAVSQRKANIQMMLSQVRSLV